MAGKKTILVVENAVDDRTALVELFSGLGYDVDEAAQSDEALRLFRARNHDLIVVEIIIPGVGGLSVCKQIKQMATYDVKVIVTSKLQQSPGMQKSAMERSLADVFLQKPFEMGTLIEKALDLLGDSDRAPAAIDTGVENDGVEDDEPDDAVDDDDLGDFEDVPAPPRNEVPPVASPSERPPVAAPPAKSAKANIAPEGEFDLRRLGEILGGLFASRFTGALRVDGEAGTKQIFFSDGTPIYVQSNIRSESLGRLLVADGLLSEEDYGKILAESAETGDRLGSLLVRRRLMSSEDLASYLAEQTAVKVAELYAWDKGRYRLAPEVAYPAEAATFDAPPAKVLLTAYRRFYPAGSLDARFQKDKNLVLVSTPNEAYRDAGEYVTAEEQKLLYAINGALTFADVIAGSSTGTMEGIRLIYGYLEMGLLGLVSEPSKAKASAAEPAGAFAQRPTPARDVDEINQVALVDEMAVRMDTLSHFEMLGVDESASEQEINEAYRRQLKRFAPERLGFDARPGVVRRAKNVVRRLATAHEVLADGPSRREYIKSLRRNAGRVVAAADDEDARKARKKVMSAESAGQKGEMAMKRGRYAYAVDSFTRAIEANPKSAEYQARLGWAIYKLVTEARPSLEEAKSKLSRAILMAEDNVEYRMWLAQVLKDLGDDEGALKQYLKVQELDPRNEEAVRQARYTNMAVEKKREAEKGRSLFGFKK
ncbi:response regulator [bacterium]|nr:response regulator [bacterium]